MHDGQHLFSPDALFGDWQVGPTLDEAIASGSLAPVLVLALDNTAARFDEYTQVEEVIDGQTVGGRADEYAAFVVEGVLPFFEERYPISAAPEATTDAARRLRRRPTARPAHLRRQRRRRGPRLPR